MKLKGQIKGVDRRVADQRRGGEPETEKRSFQITISPAQPTSAYYGYGNMQFVLHGRELDEFGHDLGDRVEVYILPEGHADESFMVEDLKREVLELTNKVATLTEGHREYQRRETQLSGNLSGANERYRAAVQENARLMAQLEALKLGRGDIAEPPMIESTGREASPK